MNGRVAGGNGFAFESDEDVYGGSEKKVGSIKSCWSGCRDGRDLGHLMAMCV